MQLWYAPTSPFARKARMAAHELGLTPSLELVETNPWTSIPLRHLNPLAKVPTLVLDDGEVVWESGLICERLEALTGDARLFPPVGPERWRALSLQALSDGASTAAGRLFADESRPEGQRSEAMLARFRQAIDATLDNLETTALRPDPTIGEVSIAAMLAYLDFRWPGHAWRKTRSHLATWFEIVSARPSMTQTEYHFPRSSA
jgi:glutathione S-transferase